MFNANVSMLGGFNNPVFMGTRANSPAATYNQMVYGIFEQDKGVNGVIDEGVFQGKEGDCWLLSGVLSMSYTEEGAQLIKDAISKNKDGSYNVNFKGINKSYKITQKELDRKNISALQDALGKQASRYSTGDDDMLLMELALEKVIDDRSVPVGTVQGLTGGSAYYLYQLLTDNQVAYAYGKEDQRGLVNMLQYYAYCQDSCGATVGVIDSFNGLEDDHAYAVKSLGNGMVTLVNPWDSTQEVQVSIDDMLKNSTKYDMSLVDYDLPEQKNYWQEYYFG